ncbi:N-acylglucosamine 2-epimerase [Etheostoma spectabile]|uniref:N-acylglucosamine 2-epimerase n=1 Tax=Etheostoma spectabile TaxID=54343 RepID=UPI0013AFC82E|nr:N-acylglucosamine 2-epimerase [Etheostoma spectabile]
MSVVKLEEYRERIRKELDNAVDFWLKYSHDTIHGGFFTCIGRDGTVYDELKYVWLQGRQVWMYCRLYRTMDRFRKPEILEAAKAGVCVSVEIRPRLPAASGKGLSSPPPTRKRGENPGKTPKETLFRVFHILAPGDLSREATDPRSHSVVFFPLWAETVWSRIYGGRGTRLGLGGPPGVPRGKVSPQQLRSPDASRGLVQQLTDGRGQEVVHRYRELASWCVRQILQHVQRDGTAILENVSPEGAELPGCQGRLQNPGHALEAGWFLLQVSAEQGDAELQQTAINKFVELPYQKGWDKEHGGLFYFLDVDGHCPTQLEWSMKLWWPHCEALIAFLMAYSQTQKPQLLETFSQVYEYTFNHFPDTKNGEWFGYLTQEGRVTLDFKGGPFKGFFHVPRCLYMCERMLDDLLANTKDSA